MQKTFEHTFNINNTCLVRIFGVWQRVNGDIEFSVDSVQSSLGGIKWDYVPYSFIQWFGGTEKIDETVFNYIVTSCVNADAPDTTTDRTQTESDLLLNNKLD